MADFFGTRWWTRGWTLQELIAPRTVVFYNSHWEAVANKMLWASKIDSHMDIPDAILRGATSLSSCTVAERMSWAANRKTTRPEDIAYSLLGIFDVNMSLLYGEGSKAFFRLQEEILKRTEDYTMFLWSTKRYLSGNLFPMLLEQESDTLCGTVASSPSNFKHINLGLSTWSFTSTATDVAPSPPQITSRGLRITLSLKAIEFDDNQIPPMVKGSRGVSFATDVNAFLSDLRGSQNYPLFFTAWASRRLYIAALPCNSPSKMSPCILLYTFDDFTPSGSRDDIFTGTRVKWFRTTVTSHERASWIPTTCYLDADAHEHRRGKLLQLTVYRRPYDLNLYSRTPHATWLKSGTGRGTLSRYVQAEAPGVSFYIATTNHRFLLSCGDSPLGRPYIQCIPLLPSADHGLWMPPSSDISSSSNNDWIRIVTEKRLGLLDGEAHVSVWVQVVNGREFYSVWLDEVPWR